MPEKEPLRVIKPNSPSNHLSPHILRNVDFLRALAGSKRAKCRRNTLIERASPEQLLCLVEICLNILRARLPLNRRQRRQLLAHAHHIRQLSRVRSAQAARRLLLSSPPQTGRGIFIPIAASLLANLAVPLIEEAIHRLTAK